jgi:hypothetical protein
MSKATARTTKTTADSSPEPVYRPAAFHVRLPGQPRSTITPPDCPCGDMTYHHDHGDDDQWCKHLHAFYEGGMIDLLAPDQTTWAMGSFTGRTDANGNLAVYTLTLMHCSAHGILGSQGAGGEPKLCSCAVLVFSDLGWRPAPRAEAGKAVA